MKEDLLSLLRCPGCGKSLSLDSGWGRASGNECEVESGLLQCSCGAEYEITEGVPRLLEPALVGAGCSNGSSSESSSRQAAATEAHSKGQPDPYLYIRQSFSREWQLFDYDQDKTWGWTLTERKRIFLDDIGMNEAELEGKTVLDAGCGNGTLTAALANFKAQIVGIDLNDGLGRAQRNAQRNAGTRAGSVQYVQGNLATPPLAPRSFDVIYCSGVLHHMPNTKQSFNRLVSLIKPGGRMYIWVYGKRNPIVRAYTGCGRGLKRVLSPQGLLETCKLMAPVYKVTTDALDACGISEFRKRTTREITLDLFDAFAPEFNHRHTEQEVQAWFVEAGFANVTVSGIQKHGFGVYGDKLR